HHRLFVVGELPLDRIDREMPVEAEDLAQQFLAEAVHHRHDDDQRRHADGDAGQGECGNDGNEGVLAAGAQIAPGNEELEARERPVAVAGGRRSCAQTWPRLCGTIRSFSRATAPAIGSVSRSPLARCLISACPSLSPRGPMISWYGMPIRSAVANLPP